MKKLSKEEMKKVTGGVVADGDCGIKIDGEWIRIWGDGNGSPTKPHAIEAVENGTATNWCCDSCPWN